MTLNGSSINAKTVTGIAILTVMIGLVSWVMLHNSSQQASSTKKTNVVLVEDL